MTTKKTKTKKKSKAAINNKTGLVSVKNNKKGRNIGKKNKINSKLLMIIAFFTGVLLIISSYAWLSASLDVKIKFFDLVVSSDNGLFISLDGVDYSDSVEISVNSVITDLKSTYSNHTNQWATGGLWPVSSNGIRNSNSNKFAIYVGEVSHYKGRNKSSKKFLNTKLITEDKSNASNVYIAFDLFLKNVSGSPNSDNLYLDEDTFIDFDEERFLDYDDATPDEVMNSLSGVMNSMRFGFVKIDSVSSKTNINTIQNLTCNNRCEMVIYEPNNNLHSDVSISRAKEYGINLVDGKYTPTYAVVNEGEYLEHTNGQDGSGIELDAAHFALQHTITAFDKPIFTIPNGVTKLRAYVWIEGQDIDSLETNSKGAAVYIAINFEKDLAGYE